MTATASYRQYLLLAPLPAWRASATGLTEDAAGFYRLDPLPGGALPVAALAALSRARPVAIAEGSDGRLYVLGADGRIHVAPAGCETALRVIRGVGGKGRDARHFRNAADIALLQGGALAVADSGDGAVKLFSAYPYALLAVTGGLGRPVRLAAGWRDALFVLDAHGNRVLWLDRDLAARGVLAGLTAPAAIAASATAIAAADGSDIRVFANPAAPPVTAGQVPGASALCFGASGWLYVGTDTGLIYSFAPDGKGGWREAGIGVLGQQAPILRMIRQGGTTLLALVRPDGAKDAQIWSIDTEAARVREGTLATQELDSNIAHCGWHRIALDADLPDGTSIEVTTQAYDAPGGSPPPDLIAAPIVLTGAARDCLVQGGPGRYFKLTLRLRGNGVATPVLRGIRIWFPRSGWLQYLPAVYQEDEQSAAFLSRFLAILQTAFDGFDETIDDIWMLFDARSVPGKWFDWLAAWIALPIEPGWTDAQRRAVLRGAFATYRKRGTAAGIEQLVSDYAGVGARLVEHFRLRQLIVLPDDPAKATATGAGRLWSRDAYRRLQLGVYSEVGMFSLADQPEPAMEPLAWGANRFSVFFDAAPLSVAATRKRVVTVIEREKPAHTAATYRPVFARMRVGVQATLGIDTRVGAAGEAVLGRVSTLGYDAILGCRNLPAGLPSRRAATSPRLGIDTRLV
jgi:phage tail-like protein